MLIILGGLPGVGKSKVGQQLAEVRQAVYIRVDTIEQVLRDVYASNREVAKEGYLIANKVARDNLLVGRTVVADSVNPIDISRAAWREVALELNKQYVEVELFCSDKSQHKYRVENREVTVPNLSLPTWKDVLNRTYEPWRGKHMKIDTAIYSVNKVVELISRTIDEST